MTAPSIGQPVAPAPAWLSYQPRELRFGTSGLRGRVAEMTDLEIYINTRGFLGYLQEGGAPRGPERVAIAEDLRRVDPSTGIESSPRIARAVARAVRDAGCEVVHYGAIPTPALAYQAGRAIHGQDKQPQPCIMVTGSHIPADRNGVKFYKPTGEVLKSDEAGILRAVRQVRREEYGKTAAASPFDERGLLREIRAPEEIDPSAAEAYVHRYTSLFAERRPLVDQRIVVYQHSAVGRDLLLDVLQALGAETVAVDRSDVFVSVDTEDVTAADEARYLRYTEAHRPHATISTDGDSDRPLFVDERGRFHRGDVLGIVAAELVGARFAAVPISTSDALDLHVERQRTSGEPAPLQIRKTRIGSPYVIAAMSDAASRGIERVVGWEANGGFMTATDVPLGAGVLTALPTRDALLPILAPLIRAAELGVPVSRLFDELPARMTRAGLLDDFPTDTSQAIISRLTPDAAELVQADFVGDELRVRLGESEQDEPASAGLRDSLAACRARLERHFSRERGFGRVTRVSFVDGVRIWFAGGDIAHLRPSGNAPQFRIYAVSDRQSRADEIVAAAIGEPHGLLRQMEREL